MHALSADFALQSMISDMYGDGFAYKSFTFELGVLKSLIANSRFPLERFVFNNADHPR
jgi:hypothetical protein